MFSGERNFFIAYDETRMRKPPEPQRLGWGWAPTLLSMNTGWTVGSPHPGASFDSLLDLIRAHGIRAGDVEKLTVRVAKQGADATNDNRTMPDICMQHICAVMLLEMASSPLPPLTDEKRMKDPERRR